MGTFVSLLFWIGIFFFVFRKAGKGKEKSADGKKKATGRYAGSVKRERAGGNGSLHEQYLEAKQKVQAELSEAVKEAAEEVRRSNDPDRRNAHRSAQPEAVRRKKSTETVRSAAVLRKSSGLESLEDDDHDWLAGQLAEERRSYRAVSEMFEVKMSHLSSCAAENLRLDHALRCDAAKLAEESRRKR